ARLVRHAVLHEMLDAEPPDLLVAEARLAHQPARRGVDLLPVRGAPPQDIEFRDLGRERAARVQLRFGLPDREPRAVEEFHPVETFGLLGHVFDPVGQVFAEFVLGLEAEVWVVVFGGGADGLVGDGVDGGEVVEVVDLHGVFAGGGLLGEVLWVDDCFADLDGSDLCWGVTFCEGGFFSLGVFCGDCSGNFFILLYQAEFCSLDAFVSRRRASMQAGRFVESPPRPGMTKRKRDQGYYTKRMKAVQEGSNEQVLLADVQDLLRKANIGELKNHNAINDREAAVKEAEASFELPQRFSEIDVEISALSSVGNGLGLSTSSDHVFVVPFTLPGDVVKAKVVTHFANDSYSLTDFVSVLKPSPQRNDSLVQCQYFAKCSGCQFQMLSYDEQLVHKKTIVEKAYRHFSSLAPESIPVVGDTIGSPMQYGYRTKITPHFDGPPGSMSRRAKKHPEERQGFDYVPPVGFMVKGTRKTMDIEDCPIATDAVRDGLRKERKRIAEEISKYKRGATILLRETTTRTDTEAVTNVANPPSPETSRLLPPGQIPDTSPNHPPPSFSPTFTETKTYITDQNALSTEHIGPYTFRNPAGAFFQNNNSILPTFTSYIRSHILPSSSQPKKPNYLIDAYSGSGLFAITLSPLFTACIGIDIAPSSIASARSNATLNRVTNAEFVTGDSADIFAQAKHFPPDDSVVVIDPPRKGCDEGFLRQLLGFRPRRVVY
ncbi:MAG: hypothetical protein Q9177_006400, partial [Variospora cf. flavescens]